MTTKDPSDGLHTQMYGFLVVGSVSPAGDADGMTANWGTQVSFEPRLYAIAIESSAHTRRNIEATRVFSISFMPGGTQDLALRFAKRSTRGSRLEGHAVSYFETGSPVLDRAVGWIECRVVATHEAGDHVLFIGEVVGGGSGPGVGDPTTLAGIGLSYAG
jgi:flavin reductase (DIM6/NTAB) family NADH-FMN oxidoreductase RutF